MSTSRGNKRLEVLLNQVDPKSKKSTTQKTSLKNNKTSSKSNDDIVIVCSVRTAVGRARKGGFKDTPADKLLEPVFKHLLKKTKIDPKIIGDIVIGKVLGDSGMGATQVRIAALCAGIPETVPCTTVNRQCSSGLQALGQVAASVKAGFYDVGIAGGVESMSFDKMPGMEAWKGQINKEALRHKKAKGCFISMGVTSENVAAKYNISRTKQDWYAEQSHKRALNARETGRFEDEIVPVTTKWQDKKTGEWKTITVSKDEGIRPGTNVQGLAKLRAVFKKGGSTTAGNASQLSDGASAMLVMKRSTANILGLKIEGVFKSFSVVGVDPHIMGIGPAVAIPASVKKAGLRLKDIDLFEINEAFASQYSYTVESLGLDFKNKVNVNGGAIALGHPLGCTGARMTATLLSELKKRKQRYGIVSMCIGTGMGASAVFEVEE